MNWRVVIALSGELSRRLCAMQLARCAASQTGARGCASQSKAVPTFVLRLTPIPFNKVTQVER